MDVDVLVGVCGRICLPQTALLEALQKEVRLAAGARQSQRPVKTIPILATSTTILATSTVISVQHPPLFPRNLRSLPNQFGKFVDVALVLTSGSAKRRPVLCCQRAANVQTKVLDWF